MQFENIISRLTTALLFAAIAGCLVLDDWLSNLTGLLVLLGVVVWLKQPAAGDRKMRFDRNEKLLLFAFSFFALLALLSWLGSGTTYEGWKNLGRYLRFVLAFPLLALLLRVRLSQAVFWLAVIVAALLSGAVAVYQVGAGDAGFSAAALFSPDTYQRAQGPTNPIIFGDLSLLLAFLALFGTHYFYHDNDRRWLIALGILAFIAATIASILSQTRGAWLAYPAFVILATWLIRQHRLHVLVVTLIVTVAFLWLTETGSEQRFKQDLPWLDLTRQELPGTYSANHSVANPDTDVKDDPVGLRPGLWRLALTVFARDPLTGVGMGRFYEHIDNQVASGKLPARAEGLEHAHNDLLNALATRGVAGGLSLLLLFTIPFVSFWRQLASDSADVRRLALAGLLVASGYAIFSLTESVFERGLFITFYILMLAWLYVLLRHAREAALNGQRGCKVSVTVITKNEERLIEDCLQSVLPVADEIIVLDCGSTDRTVELTRHYTDKVEVTDWPGYGPQKQRALERATGDWVLSIDADEQLTPYLAKEINHVLSRERGISAYKLPWAVTLYGKQLDFGRSGRAPLRLFRREGARFTDDVVHESIQLPAGSRTQTLTGRLLHFTHRDYGHALEKSAAYAWLGSQRKYSAGKRRASLLHASVWSLLTFLHVYFIRLGFLDGRIGFLVAVQYAQTNFNKYAGLWTLLRQDKLDGKANQ